MRARWANTIKHQPGPDQIREGLARDKIEQSGAIRQVDATKLRHPCKQQMGALNLLLGEWRILIG